MKRQNVSGCRHFGFFFFKHGSDNFILSPEARYTKTKCSGFIFIIAIADFYKENLINKRRKNTLVINT